jgi:glycosidase
MLVTVLACSACRRSPVDAAAGTEGYPWWNDRVFYEVFVRSFRDSDGDGIGDLQGLIDRLDYLNDGDHLTDVDLGVTGIWLMPVAESPSYHGYDVVDYRQVERDYGTNADLIRLIDEAHRRDMVVIVDLVLNHTSSQHPWFLDALTPGSQHDTWYVWRDEDPGFRSPWGSQVWHRAGDRYYYALFWSGMPDLNLENKKVTRELHDIARFWLADVGVDGFRLDGVKHYIENGALQEHTEDTHQWVERLRRTVRRTSPSALVVGEVWSHTEYAAAYVGDELDLVFEFDLAEAILESVRRGDKRSLSSVQQSVLQAYPPGQYAVFLSNHDQNRVLDQLRGDVSAAKVAATLLLTNPGVPFVYYGEEIGMSGSKPDERIRTPMSWDSSPAGGFTDGSPWQTMADSHPTANVQGLSGDPSSLLNHYRALIDLRDRHPALRIGEMWPVECESRQVYAYLRTSQDEALLIVVNLSDDTVSRPSLTLEESPLTPNPRGALLLGVADISLPDIGEAGGFERYVVAEALPPRSALIVDLTSASQ